MSLHRDLLSQAHHLLKKEPRRPRQASLRRAVSAAYYALFHLLVGESSKMVVSGALHSNLRDLVGRAYEHAEMRQASKAFASTGLPPHLQSLLPAGVPAGIRTVAEVFVLLQEARHNADYNRALTWTRSEAHDIVKRAEQSFQAWHAVRDTPETRVYLAALLLWRKWGR